MIDTPTRGWKRLKDRRRLRQVRNPRAKAKRVTTVVVDQPVLCPQCSDFMRLSQDHTFKCRRCGQEIAAEDAIKVLETVAAT